MWLELMKLIGGPVVAGLIDAYKAHLTAATNDKKIAADLAGQEIAAQTAETQAITQLKIAEIGHPFEVEKLFAYVVLAYFAKLLIWDKVVGSFVLGAGPLHSSFATDPLNSVDAVWGGLVITWYFGKKTAQNVISILKAR